MLKNQCFSKQSVCVAEYCGGFGDCPGRTPGHSGAWTHEQRPRNHHNTLQCIAATNLAIKKPLKQIA